jgi:hypothetical protein
LGLCMVAFKVRVNAYFLSPFILNAMEGFEDCMLRAQSICQNLGVFAVLALKQ